MRRAADVLGHRERSGDVLVGFTDATLDVAEEAPGRDEALNDAVTALAGAGVPAVRMRQVHGASVAVVDEVPDGGLVPDVDALVTTCADLALVVRAADCVPLVLAGEGVVAVAHAGRPGVVAGVVPAVVARMRDLGAGVVRAWVGPAVCGRCYEVPDEMRETVSAVVPEARAETSWGTPAVDVVAGVLAQLRAAGVRADDITDLGACTREDDALHSYRRDGTAAGRLAGIVVRRPERET
ncbi:MAG: polyphenol oxidase family protein [Nocardioides sp.]|nr:polyphenol oxidase family protein [Nocardioides sp.]